MGLEMAKSRHSPGAFEVLEESLTRVGVVAVVQLPNPSLAVPLADALSARGLTALEVTFRAAGAVEAIAAIRAHCPDVLVGAGTVLRVDQANAALDAGAAFIVAPGTNSRLVEHVLARGGVMIPGVATPSEIDANLRVGIRLMKLFPAGPLGGTTFLRAMGGPYPNVSFVPTGGVSASNLRDYLAEPNVCACGGTWIAPVSVLEAGDLSQVERNASQAAAVVRDMRPPSGMAGTGLLESDRAGGCR